MNPNNILNTAAYRFVPLDNLDALRTQLNNKAIELNIRGTILVSPEGINIFLAATPEAIAAYRQYLDQDTRFANMVWKDSWSNTVPFKKFKIRIKPEIITFKQDNIDPVGRPAPFVEPKVLEQWLNQGHDAQQRPIVMIDTRNTFEVEAGTFKQAIDPDIQKFTDFPASMKALLRQRPELSEAAVVTFCTGGIRCEKAAPWMLANGFNHVYQIDGGILRYFEECGDAHYDGHCIVFDERKALDDALAPAA